MSQNAPQPVPSAFQKSMSLRHLEAYFVSLPDAIMVWDRAGKLLFLNAAALTFFEVQVSDPWFGASAQQFLQRYEWCDEQQRPFSFPPCLLDLTTFKGICQNSGHGEKCPQKVRNASCKTSSWWGKHKYMSAVLE
ncbi:hypothetical protein KSC_071380 [Ktedonobacter sp. SOSP1-52]|uniref:PAS domain-containing protein n=1 Tax=Ktedonobacter sp. SOSP1-52 TaxID=2778366 RepID=UPI001915797A|nr:PAS domain-containing protein [Ktedonobacter sp. SOSP1-52]GHO68246.1 hypothetical protein KSC_071380 [Ktedonobacter sp. SOSP1-52]